MWKLLFDNGVFTTPVISPAVPPGRALIRTNIMATHTLYQLNKVLAVFDRAGRELGVLKGRSKRRRYSEHLINVDGIKRWMRFIWKTSRRKYLHKKKRPLKAA